MTMDCERVRDGMALRVTGPLSPSEEEGVSRHLAECAACRAESVRLKRLVSVLQAVPEEEWSRPPRTAKPRKSLGMAVAAGVLFALGASLAAPRWGERPTLEGDFVQDGVTWTASTSTSAVDLAGHRCVCRKSTRIRIAGPKDLEIESGRLDVSGEGGKFRIGTPLGRVEVLGTDFSVEVMPVKKSAVGGFLVGVFVTSGVVSYGDLRLERGQAAVAETGKAPRKVQGRDLEQRLRTAQEAGRDLERKLAALDFEKARLSAELAAVKTGTPPPAPAKLTPEDRRVRFRRLARLFVPAPARDVPAPTADDPDAAPPPRGSLDPKMLAEAVAAANELNVTIFAPGGSLAYREFAQELLLEILESKGAVADVHRAKVEAAVNQAYGQVKDAYEFSFEKNQAVIQALGRAIDLLENSLDPKAIEEVARLAVEMIGTSALPSFSNGGTPVSTAEGISTMYGAILTKSLGFEEAQAPLLQAVVSDWIPAVLADALPENPGPREMLRYSLRARDRSFELARRLAIKFPEKKGQIESLFTW
jgi:hypothetical protein